MKIILNMGGFEKVIEGSVFAPKYFYPWRCKNGNVVQLEFLYKTSKEDTLYYELSESGQETLGYMFGQYETYRRQRDEIEELHNKLWREVSKSKWQKFKELLK